MWRHALAALALMGMSGVVSAAVAPNLRCQAAKLGAAGRYASRLLICRAASARRGVSTYGVCTGAARNRLLAAFARAESGGACIQNGEVEAIAASAETFAAAAAAQIWLEPQRNGCAARRLSATGRRAAKLLRAHGEQRAGASETRWFLLLSRANAGFEAAFLKTLGRSDCSSSVAAGDLEATVDAFAGDALVILNAGPHLRQVGDRAGLRLGAAAGAYDSTVVLGEADYTATLGREFNNLTPENDLKWGPVHPAPDVWSFEKADALIAFATAHGMRVKGHTLVWHQQLPPWVNAGLSAAELRSAMDDHIATLVGRYRGQVAMWDVVNEAVNDSGSGLRSTVFSNTLGPGYIAEAFEKAHAADPQAILLYNDYGIDAVNAKSDYVYNLIADLRQQGIPIHGVGLQMHLDAAFVFVPSIRANMQRFSDLGVQVHISEMDVQIHNLPGDLPSRLAVQRQVYHDVVAACRAVSGCRSVTFWGFTDKYSWIDAFFGPDDPLLFDDLYVAKPAYYGVFDALLGN